jgi:hypothetical protein
MARKLPLKKLVVELRFKADLAFYGKMDSIGIELAKEYPDWQRSPLTLDVRGIKKHRRLFLSVNRAVFEMDDPDADIDLGYTEKLLKQVVPKLDVKALDRIGVRQWFAADLGKPFALMVDEISQRFLSRNPDLTNILNDKTKDVAYAVDYESADGWLYHLRMGPMMKAQWFQSVVHELNNFEQDKDAKGTFENFQNSFPEQFLFIDLDCYKEEQPADKLDKFLNSARRRSHDLVGKLIEFCKK